MDYIVETKGLTKQYGDKEVVKDVDLKVPRAHVYGFMGPNGAGKSTTLKMILGLIRKSAGQVTIDGISVNRKNRIEVLRETGSLIESPSYYGHLTGKENLEIVRTLKNVPEQEIDQVLKLVRMESQQNKRVREYSLGMKQRLGLAEALLGRPELLILDEPTNGLDPAGIQEMRELICTLPSGYGITVIVSSHLLGEIDQMADHVGIIRKGELVYQNTLESLHSHSKEQIALRVSHMAIALDLLRQDGIEATQEDGYLLLPMVDDTYVANLCRLLVAQNISLYRVEKREKSLEDIFLSLTGKETSL